MDLDRRRLAVTRTELDIRVAIAVCGIAVSVTTPAYALGAEKDISRLLREAAAEYPTNHAFRFDPPRPQTKEPIYHQPESLGYDIERGATGFANKARAKDLPWAGFWWPMNRDGIAYAEIGGTSPIAKYAKAFGLDEAAARWEKHHHGSEGEHEPAAWWGHCNGLAAASIMEPRPRTAVEHNGVTFEPADIQALLCEVYYGCSALGLDRRYDGADTFEVDEYGRPVAAEYRDINPGALHLLLGNVIGRDGKAVVVDISAGSEVWNYPTVGYEINRSDEVDSAGAMLAICGRRLEGPYPFNPDAKRFFVVKLTLEIGAMHGSPAEFENERRAYLYSTLLLDYVLECDGDGNVLGGEWAGESRTKHPDFAWVPLTPSSSFTYTPDGRRVVGTSGDSNPYVVYEEVKALLDRSVGAAPSPVAGGEGANSEADPASSTCAADRRTSDSGCDIRFGPSRWDRPIADTPSGTIRRFQVADAAITQGEFPSAVAQLDLGIAQIARRSPADPIEALVLEELRLRRGWTHFLAGEYDDAMNDYLALPTTGAIGPVVLARRAILRVCRGDETWKALLDAAAAIQENPQNPWGYCARGWVYLTRRAELDVERAIADFEKAAELGGDPLSFAGLELARQQTRASQGGAAQASPVQSIERQLPRRWVQRLQAQSKPKC